MLTWQIDCTHKKHNVYTVYSRTFTNSQGHWVHIVTTWSIVKFKVLSVGEKQSI